ncbi:hypothetical protein [Maridesulfovibrio ferrireducens]|uniref:hypothetical protein n=1 Tax=Maridesulfovibrio ferrireducens TaxID=246191 RepID=UPI001A22C9D5|nr:hypothetical protein [Maridesulfovibrio ferrireducens]MBI9109963.1 hypothetical protein [Maridesulfovibrio ferrireducens]
MKNESITDLINSGEMSQARSIIVSKLDGDRFKENMEIASSWGQFPEDLYDEDDNDSNFLSEELWSREYWTEMRVGLSNNFSKKKLNHIITVMQHLRKKKDPKFTPNRSEAVTPNKSTVKKERAPRHSETIMTPKRVVFLGGGFLGGVAGFTLKESLVGAVAGGALGVVLGFALLHILGTKK